MRWDQLYKENRIPTSIFHATCEKCEERSVWLYAPLRTIEVVRIAPNSPKPPPPLVGQMLFPLDSTAPMPHQDLPEDCRQDYMEARAVEVHSPRAAAGLLRVVVERLAQRFGEPEKDTNQNIRLMVQKGLPVSLQQAFDSLRVIGSAGVHHGIMNIDDTPEIVTSLFDLVNIIVEKMITEPQKINALYEKIPESRRENIDKSDKRG
ncbi:hypothetical protein HNO92_004297 [Chromobacterium alkanivorans]|uniref:DUF4145 domain-containing protein n=1 Tax=Chromobacterium alkanivorans TaxID=1071719 RepID=UPI002166F0DB|nr:DUF4145 domain-containing protein [Chromobacterium alkanivorans]MCS3806688.1 hypothetical protein [Chromobacterium alkanivorans]MCS3821140.1 hypothetical protein [Chromobacterium alkanivorans]MCS3875948.1 hypothetical protein [Chromobacterium alkanivorans]